MSIAARAIASDPKAHVCEALNQSLADTALATMLAQNFHWNVAGPHFSQLHALFQEIYEDHFAAQDDLAERIKALDGHADGHLSRMVDRSKVAEARDEASDKDMLTSLLRAQETLASTLKACGEAAAQSGDTLTEDLCIARGQTHEKFAWMLRAHLR
jgi:starvation-inducible DNA-binding protein